MRDIAAALLLGLLLVGSAAADEKPAEPPKPLTLEQAADNVLEALAAKDEAALRTLAEKDDPDPWLVADELCYRGKHDAAEAFAKAAPRKATERLPAYVTSMRRKEPDREARRVLRDINEALRRGRPDLVPRIAPSTDGTPESVTGIRLVLRRGDALLALRRSREGTTAYRIASDAATQLGWQVCAAAAHEQAGQCYYIASDLRAARASLQTVLSLREELGDRAGVAATLRRLGIVAHRLGNPSEALRLHARALALLAALGDGAGMASVLLNVGDVHLDRRDYEEALQSFTRALKVGDTDANPAGAPLTLGKIGLTYQRLGDHTRALEYQERALALFEQLGDRPSVAAALGNIGLIHEHFGDYQKALDLYTRAMKTFEALGAHGGFANTLGNIGNVHLRLGNYPKALELQKRALEAYGRLNDVRGAMRTLGNIGSVQEALGNYPEALRSFGRALEAAEGLGDRAGVALALGSIGNVHLRFGDYRRALEFQKRALNLHEVLGERAHAAFALGKLAIVHRGLGDYDLALEFQTRALHMKEALGDRLNAAYSLNQIGQIHRFRGNHAQALGFHARALASFKALDVQTGIVETLNDMALAQARLGDYRKALETLGRARELLAYVDAPVTRVFTLDRLAGLNLEQGAYVEALRFARETVAVVSGLVSGLGEQEGATARERWIGPFQVGARAALEVGSEADAAFFLESARAGGLREALNARQALASSLIPADLRAAEASARRREANALARYERIRKEGKRAEIRAARDALGKARDDLEAVVQRIQREAKAGADVAYPEAAPLASIQGWLRDGEALLLLGSTGEGLVALVVTRQAASARPLGAAEEIEKRIEALDLDDVQADPAAALEALRARVIAPLGLDDTIKRVLVSPYGALSYVPFSLLLPNREVVYVPSGTTYGVLVEEREKRGESVLALGDPDYGVPFDPRTVAVVRGGRRLRTLPATRKEVEGVGDRVLLGGDATEAGLADAVKEQKRWRAVHLACHGLIDPERPMFSSLAFTPDGADDGFLTCLEVFRMKIPADLVVLSACETATGKVYRAEGIVGLTRAFMFAGAPRVICSLWKVDDEATQALMIRFYELWNPKEGEGLGAAAALKQAQEFIRGHVKWSHPYYWAAWVLWGLAD